MKSIGTKLSLSKIGKANPNAKAIKCKNAVTNEELQFETVKQCQEYFNEKTHRFITTRVKHEVNGLFRNEWMIAYIDEDYGTYKQARHRVGKKLVIEDLDSLRTEVVDSVRLAAKKFNLSRNIINNNIKKGLHSFVVGKYKITTLN